MLANQPIERSRPAVIAFHGDTHRQRVTHFKGSNTAKELVKTGGVMINIEFVNECAIGQSDCHAVAHTANINTGTKIRASRTIQPMRTVIETPTFQKQAEKVWTEAERLGFLD